MSICRHHLANRLQRVEIVDVDARGLAGARDVQPPIFDVHIYVVKTAIAADFGCLEHLIRSRGSGLLGPSRGGKNCHDCCNS